GRHEDVHERLRAAFGRVEGGVRGVDRAGFRVDRAREGELEIGGERARAGERRVQRGRVGRHARGAGELAQRVAEGDIIRRRGRRGKVRGERDDARRGLDARGVARGGGRLREHLEDLREGRVVLERGDLAERLLRVLRAQAA